MAETPVQVAVKFHRQPIYPTLPVRFLIQRRRPRVTHTQVCGTATEYQLYGLSSII
jgi:hypothetical protein